MLICAEKLSKESLLSAWVWGEGLGEDASFVSDAITFVLLSILFNPFLQRDRLWQH
jgi:hypothetical protein